MKTLILFCTLLTASPAWATSLAFSEATLDWTGFHYTLSDGMTAEFVDMTTLVSARTPPGELIHGEFGALVTAGAVFPGAHATATASGVNGFMTSAATVGTTTLTPELAASGGSTVGFSRLLFMQGVGVLSVSIPYTLTIGLHETNPENEVTAAYASIAFMGNQQVLEWDNARDGRLEGTLTRSGLFIGSQSVAQNVCDGVPCASIGYAQLGGGLQTTASARTVGTGPISEGASVPEPTSWLLLGLGLLSLGSLWWIDIRRAS